MSKVIMIQGTMSNAGKSLLAAVTHAVFLSYDVSGGTV